ncbi:class II glutamine amidotransferase [Methanotorris formicicus]|uniref:Glutamine amidotransferase class-II n=1 Tax=Methanotorris formicicus Mc-S-70 TaxID=647171 RepID=H1KZH6_9EURY|nr:class II glutamine amidotransferase [Methanotorris formicicus]EHP85984.1 glutamine amidotransferase class-II [Methanotorris formicicus Mc-S-70]
MCELLGICFNKKVNVKLSLNSFKLRSEEHPNGWGIAFYPDGFVRLIKEPIKMNDALLANCVRWTKIKSKIFIAHIRKASAGSESYVNTHPFVRKLDDKEIAFAHNGTLLGYEDLELDGYYPIGETDSEYVFCYLLSQIERRGIEWDKEGFDNLLDILLDINYYGAFNCLFSDGEYLFAYKDYRGLRKLYFLKRMPPYGRIKLRDEDYVVNLGDIKDLSEEGFVIATNPLSNENWKSFENGELMVFKNGEMIYSNRRLTDLELKILKILRESPHRVSLMDIIKNLRHLSPNIMYDESVVKIGVRNLLYRGYIKQDGRDVVDWDDLEATFYTKSEKRAEIDRNLEEFGFEGRGFCINLFRK